MVTMRRHALALFPILTVALASTGCLRSTTTIDLRPDGSGTIVQESGMTAQALAMLKGIAASQGQGAEKAPGADIFSEEQARKTAETMGVTFVSGEPFKTADLEGYRARYRFDDIAKIKVNMEQAAPQVAGKSGQPPFAFGFQRGANSSVLTIDMPDSPGGAFPGMPGAGKGASDADKAQAQQALAMMKAMMQGMFVDVSLNVSGRVIKTNAPLVDGSRVTLLQLDLDKLLADEASLQKLQSATTFKSLSGVAGLKVPSEPKLMIEFSR